MRLLADPDDAGWNIPDLPSHLHDLRQEVRGFLATELASGGFAVDPAGWDRYDPAFSRKVATRGWIGMTWPRRYGGHERSSLERYVVTEELLAAGAPVRAHWLADRQIGPLLLSAGTEAQKQEFLPRIAAGTCFVCVGLSEPDSGSDLSSIRTAARKVEGGWRITGRKVWTSYAHRAHLINLFARTAPRDEANRHAGVTQFLIDLDAPGLARRPIRNLADEHDFNEVVLDEVFVPDDRVIGKVGGAWSQVNDELAHERAGSERWMNTMGLLRGLADQLRHPATDRRDLAVVGRLAAHLWTLHRMSLGIAVLLGEGIVPEVEAAMVKDLGTHFDQEVPRRAREVLTEGRRAEWPEGDALEAALEHAVLYAPSTTIRGGTTEILRGIVARGLGLR
jgi:acyl-CoA dehydrogenase